MSQAHALACLSIVLAALSGAAGRCFWLYICINGAALLVAVVAATSRRKGKPHGLQRLAVAVQ